MTLETVQLPPVLNAKDRCDRCSAPALVRAVKGSAPGHLDFCGHHYRRYEEPLAFQGFHVLVDQRDQVNVKPSPSASV